MTAGSAACSRRFAVLFLGLTCLAAPACDPCSGLEGAATLSAAASDRPEAVFAVRLSALDRALASLSRKGPRRGVRRRLPALEGDDGGVVYVVAAGRAPVKLVAETVTCPNCAVLSANIPLTLSSSPEPVSRSSLRVLANTTVAVEVPLRVGVSRSSELPGWWALHLENRPDAETRLELGAALASGQGQALDARIERLALDVAAADALELAGRTELLQFRPWTSTAPALRLASAEVRMGADRLEVLLTPGVDLAGPGLEQSQDRWVAGQEVRLEVSPALVAALAVAGQAAPADGAPDAGGSHGVEVQDLSYEGSQLILEFRARERQRCGWFDGAAIVGGAKTEGGRSLGPLDRPVRLVGSGGSDRFPSQAELSASAERASQGLLPAFETLAVVAPRGKPIDLGFEDVGPTSLVFAASLRARKLPRTPRGERLPGAPPRLPRGLR